MRKDGVVQWHVETISPQVESMIWRGLAQHSMTRDFDADAKDRGIYCFSLISMHAIKERNEKGKTNDAPNQPFHALSKFVLSPKTPKISMLIRIRFMLF